ncbi:MAG: DUF3794 domain-containing protein [Oscillospiraceae bacterium]|jgi:hypothetical protein|nr:DUF3794 domain-containing protein [Oscillospiraceae bacterium]
MELKKQTFLYYQVVLDATSAPEITADMIVPDMYPDMADVVCATGQACVKEKSLRDDRLDLTGVARVGVLYRPEGEEGLRKLDVVIPFNHVFDGRFAAQSEAFCDVRLLEAEAKAVNPRKVSVLCKLSVHATVYAPTEMEMPTDVSEPCEVRRKTCTAYMPAAAKSKAFTVNENVEIPASRPPVDEIVISRPNLSVTDVKTVGNKAVFKGAVNLNILYLSGGEPVSVEHEFSISQIMDIDGLEDGASVDFLLRFTGCEMGVNNGLGGEHRQIAVTLHFDAQAAAYMERSLEAITDLYSTQANLNLQMEPVQLTELNERGVKKQPVRESLEIGEDVRTVIDTNVTLGPITRLGGDETGCEAYVSMLYADDNGDLKSVSRRLEIPAGIDTEGAKIVNHQAGEVTAAPASGSMELRFAVDFSFLATKPFNLLTVAGVVEEEASEKPAHPSVVLRRCQEKEELWDIAKKYNTTIGELCLANGLEESEALPDGRLLLIPKKR